MEEKVRNLAYLRKKTHQNSVQEEISFRVLFEEGGAL